MADSGEEIKLIVFDLNGTFYNKSSKDEFYKFVVSKRPKRIKYIFEMAYFKLLKKLNRMRQTEFKENFFNYLDKLPPEQVEKLAKEFWEQEYPENFNKELRQHFEKMRKEGVQLFCATGGLELYVKPLFRHFPVDGFAGTEVKYEGSTYKVVGEACKEEEKLRRIASHYRPRKFRIVEAYSDSKEAILKEAEKAFLVDDDGKLSPYKK
ncbi:HAD-IB family phosphatase [Pontibacter flavimaris]|uniref:Phosphoserine phosphatase n=1 Tax=Pontibacter flavimaris TaxID=1797110 RepID=A0A1Q5PDY8_9BACT|nr:HAD-IB family phosphatase [Pontibacter flavimaris]OKL40427.1 phosphoserine phosphatase [Pontibacter flavimaris]